MNMNKQHTSGGDGSGGGGGGGKRVAEKYYTRKSKWSRCVPHTEMTHHNDIGKLFCMNRDK